MNDPHSCLAQAILEALAERRANALTSASERMGLLAPEADWSAFIRRFATHVEAHAEEVGVSGMEAAFLLGADLALRAEQIRQRREQPLTLPPDLTGDA